MVAAAHGHSQTQGSHECVADHLETNRIINGMVQAAGRVKRGRGKWITGTLTHWMKCDNRSCYFTSVFYERRISQPVLVLQQSWPKHGSTTENL
ncbi:hypothetical protein EVAR_74571_1 [Eumeta japonica]|uniref:Uncharacterized protein n=1 Tax=Eumeta variegata TaxID=151549 RepID=A0A4C1TCT9_EUMVA|nr:hypothetical protein EVAR_74571_1 [Eumeta japonica]